MIDTPVSGPHAHARGGIGRLMGLVMVALTPATLFGFYAWGWPAVYLFLVCIGSAVLAEAASLWLAGKPVRVFLMDGSAVLTAWLVAMTLPPWAPWWIGVLGGTIAIVVGKQVFGGIGQNLFNPAMVARVALLISFPLEMSTFMAPQPLFSAGAPDLLTSLAVTFGGASDAAVAGFNAITGPTILDHLKTEVGRGIPVSDAMAQAAHDPGLTFLGWTGGSLGETSAPLILLGGLFLLYRRVITWPIPVSMLGTLLALATIMHLVDAAHYAGPLVHILSGATLLGAFFIATDLVTSPVTVRGQLVFGAGIGALVFIIRTWGSYPEGVGFAVLLMNACTPLIDHYLKPRIYGRDRKGEPLGYGEEQPERSP